MLQGYKTIIFNSITVVAAAYELYSHFAILGSAATPMGMVAVIVVAIANIALRYLTTTPIFSSAVKSVQDTVIAEIQKDPTILTKIDPSIIASVTGPKPSII